MKRVFRLELELRGRALSSIHEILGPICSWEKKITDSSKEKDIMDTASIFSVWDLCSL